MVCSLGRGAVDGDIRQQSCSEAVSCLMVYEAYSHSHPEKEQMCLSHKSDFRVLLVKTIRNQISYSKYSPALPSSRADRELIIGLLTC